MTARIHPSALVDASAELGADVEIGPWAMVGPRCTVGDGSVIAARATLERNVRVGQRVRVGTGSILGGDPQDLKYRGEETWVDIGDDTTIREYVTVNRGTAHSITTTVGRNAFLMTYVHIAHDCHVGDNVIISNSTQLAGHVTVEDRATISGLCAVHQFARIGRHAFIGGCSRVAVGCAAVRACGRQPDQAVRPQFDRSAAERIRSGAGGRTSGAPIATVSARISISRRGWNVPERRSPMFRRFVSSCRLSKRVNAEWGSERHGQRHR